MPPSPRWCCPYSSLGSAHPLSPYLALYLFVRIITFHHSFLHFLPQTPPLLLLLSFRLFSPETPLGFSIDHFLLSNLTVKLYPRLSYLMTRLRALFLSLTLYYQPLAGLAWRSPLAKIASSLLLRIQSECIQSLHDKM